MDHLPRHCSVCNVCFGDAGAPHADGPDLLCARCHRFAMRGREVFGVALSDSAYDPATDAHSVTVRLSPL